MSETRPEIVLDGDISPFRQKLREASAQLKQFGAEGETAFSRMSGPLATLQSKFVAIGAILAGGAVFKEAVAQTVKFTEESTKLGRAMGISASQASVLREALDAGNTSQEEFVGAAKGLAKQIRENEDGLQAMGLKTRDAAGELRPLTDLTLEALDVLNGYRAGTDRAIAGQTMFGKGFEMTSNLANMNKQAVAEVKEQMQALGMVASVESVAAWQAYDDAGDKANLTLKGMKTTIGNALLPVLTDLSNWFATIGPGAVVVIRGAVGGLVSVFHAVTMGVTVLWETLNAMVVTVAEPIRALGEAIGRGLVGDFDGAAAAIRGIGPTISGAWSKAFDEMATKAQSTRDRIYNLFAEGTPTAAAATGGKSAGGLVKTDKAKAGKEAADPSFMATYEARLAEIKNLYEQENVLRQFSKEQELAYWRELQANLELTAKDRTTIAKRTATLELEIRRQAVKEEQDLNAVAIEHRRNAALAQVQAQQQAANFARSNGEITKRQLLTLEEQFARQRFEIEYQSLLERLELAKNDPNNSPAELARIKEQMLEVERNYQAQRAGLGQEKKKEGGAGEGGMFDSIGQSFGNATNQMLTRATTWRQQMANIFQSLYQIFVQNLIVKPVAEWFASQAKMLAIKLGFLAEDKAATSMAATTTASIKSAETGTVVAENAAQAGSGAASALASIPFAGPVLALAAMAAIYAAVMGMRGKKSAARGYDIPKGLNPMVQTHEEEMILPQKYANVIRNMAAPSGQDDSRGGGFVFAPTIKTHDSRDMLRALQDGGVLRKALDELQRNYVKN
ncbi:MAG: hypothetical protein HZA64_14115 [Rhodocyclales bacterium]|nr:hypothetical protein [Rhodocyclales bacterium]